MAELQDGIESDPVPKRKRARRISLREAQQLASIYETVADVIFQLEVRKNGRYRFSSVNPAFERVTGIPAGEVVGKWVDEIVPPESLPLVQERYATAIREARVVQWEETSRYPAGSLTGIVTLAPVFNAAGRCTHLVGAVHDATEKKTIESMLRQSQKMESIGHLAGGIAHDFNNILSVILGNAEMLLDDILPSDPVRPGLEAIRKAGERAAALTHQLLAFSRQQVLELRTVNLNETIVSMDAMLRRLIGEDISLLTRPEPGLDLVKVDPGQMEQVLMNLVVNARDAMPHGGSLTIETENVELDEEYARDHPGIAPGPHVMMAVSDTGVGMDKETIRQIFDPFFTTKERGKGTGLGLSTVFGIVRQSGGSIWVYSEPGKGTTFKVYVPRTEESAEAEVPEAAAAVRAGGTATILVAEDEEQVRALVCEVLRREGYAVLEAANGAEALSVSAAHEGPVHLMVTDVVMPHMGGPQAAERMAPLRPEMKVLFMSGYTDDAIVHHGILNEGTAFLQKPVTPRVLTRRVRELLAAE